MKTLLLVVLGYFAAVSILAACAADSRRAAPDDPDAQLIQALGDAGASGDLAHTLMFMRSPTDTVALDANRLQSLAQMQGTVLEHKAEVQAANLAAEVEMQARRTALWWSLGHWLLAAAVALGVAWALRDVAVAVFSRPAPTPAMPPILLVNFAAQLAQQGHAVEVEEVDGEWWAFDDTAMVRYNADDARRAASAPMLTDHTT